MKSYEGISKKILNHLGFLVSEYQMEFKFQTFSDFNGFCGPVDTYSFYNDNGCFTLHNIVQRGEWGWFTSKYFSDDQYELLQKEIKQTDYIKKFHLTYSGVLKELAAFIKKQIQETDRFFNISIITK